MILALVPVMMFSYLYWQNNKAMAAPTNAELKHALERAIQWLGANEDRVIKDNNPMLWSMLSKSAAVTNDGRLLGLFQRYRQEYLDPYPNNIWRTLFTMPFSGGVSPNIVYELPDYNVHFIYGLTCDRILAREQIVKRQNQITFCGDNHPISPACYTHQLMAVRFMLQNGCGNAQSNQQLADQLVAKVKRQLTWDPRVVDVYLQRLLMLVQSDHAGDIKPVWIRNVLTAQADDGSWDDFQPLLAIGSSRHFGFSARGVSVRSGANGSFHATAQGIYLLALLVQQQAMAENKSSL